METFTHRAQNYMLQWGTPSKTFFSTMTTQTIHAYLSLKYQYFCRNSEISLLFCLKISYFQMLPLTNSLLRSRAYKSSSSIYFQSLLVLQDSDYYSLQILKLLESHVIGLHFKKHCQCGATFLEGGRGTQ